MEGDKPTACMVSLKYTQLKASMEERLKTMHQNDPLFPMGDVMIDKITKYPNEGLKWDTLILAAVLHPGLRVEYLSHAFGMGADGNNCAQNLLKVVFTKRRAKMELTDQPATVIDWSQSPTNDSPFGHPLCSAEMFIWHKRL